MNDCLNKTCGFIYIIQYINGYNTSPAWTVSVLITHAPLL